MPITYSDILQILDMISFPTAIVAVLLTFFIKEINRVRQERRNQKRAIKDWFDEVVVLSRELQLVAITHESYVDLAEDELIKPDQFDNLAEFGEYMDIDESLLDTLDGSSEHSDFYNLLLKKRINKKREEILPFLSNSQEEFHRYYTKLRDQWAKMPYSYSDESISQVEKKILETATHCLYISNGEEPTQEDYDKLFELSGDLSEESVKAKESVTITKSIWNR